MGQHQLLITMGRSTPGCRTGLAFLLGFNLPGSDLGRPMDGTGARRLGDRYGHLDLRFIFAFAFFSLYLLAGCLILLFLLAFVSLCTVGSKMRHLLLFYFVPFFPPLSRLIIMGGSSVGCTRILLCPSGCLFARRDRRDLGVYHVSSASLFVSL
ncbi:hypothetical protein GALMADRAFT_456607 [Galerina marginata CBS 339.88]|uniref:Uncharacterized protein n=1 Tax=Galerina marginata (strain CBS 339.88) TaxID=685588 RepID=A0A067T116_GALM3|nr:hypothetical protein GALMADRAFT_456607 [Galerina marginata CBS 339.88]